MTTAESRLMFSLENYLEWRKRPRGHLSEPLLLLVEDFIRVMEENPEEAPRLRRVQKLFTEEDRAELRAKLV